MARCSGLHQPAPTAFHSWSSFSFPTGTVITPTMARARFYWNENVATTDYRGHWENQFSFRWEAFISVLRRSTKVWQRSLTLKGERVSKVGRRMKWSKERRRGKEELVTGREDAVINVGIWASESSWTGSRHQGRWTDDFNIPPHCIDLAGSTRGPQARPQTKGNVQRGA